MLNNNQNHPKEKAILSIIQDIKSGVIKGEDLSKEERQPCIEVLYFEGYTTAEIAQIMGKSDRTIRRDLEEIREKNSLTPSIDLAKQLIGEMVVKARTNQTRLKKLSREKASVSEKAQAIYFSHRIEMDVIARLQSLNYLPVRPQEIVAEISHHMDKPDEKSYNEMLEEIELMEKLNKNGKGLSPEVQHRISLLKSRIEKESIKKEIAELNKERGEDHE